MCPGPKGDSASLAVVGSFTLQRTVKVVSSQVSTTLDRRSVPVINQSGPAKNTYADHALYALVSLDLPLIDRHYAFGRGENASPFVSGNRAPFPKGPETIQCPMHFWLTFRPELLSSFQPRTQAIPSVLCWLRKIRKQLLALFPRRSEGY